MANVNRILQRASSSRSKIQQLLGEPHRINVIHYSCESFYKQEDSTPRVTSIAVRNLGSGVTRSFALFMEKELLQNSSGSIDQLEKSMLQKFYEFVDRERDKVWFHWGMRDMHYGFPAIEYRYRLLGGEPMQLANSSLVDISNELYKMYGPDYVPNPRLPSLVQRNKYSSKDMLGGAEEAQLADDEEYRLVHLSTLRKVNILCNIIDDVATNQLIVDSNWSKWKWHPVRIGILIKEHWIFAVVGLILTTAGTVLAIIAL